MNDESSSGRRSTVSDPGDTHARSVVRAVRPGRRGRTLPILLASLLVAAGCAMAGGGRLPADDHFDRGLALARADSFQRATTELASAARGCRGDPLGQQAVLALAALELDPRHQQGSPERAARLALHLLDRPDRARWSGRMASTLYLLASELRTGTAPLEPAPVEALYPGADEPAERWSGCGPRFDEFAAADTAARPQLPGLPLAVRAARLRARVRSLEAEMERLRSLLEPPGEPR